MKYFLALLVAGVMGFLALGFSPVDAIVTRTVSGERKVVVPKTNTGTTLARQAAVLKLKYQALLRSQKLIKARIAMLQKRIDTLQKMIDAKKAKNLPTTLLDKQMKALMDSFNKAQTTASDIQKKIDDTNSSVIDKI